jgi:hypothetical protein
MNKLQFRVLLCVFLIAFIFGETFDFAFPSDIYSKVYECAIEVEPTLSQLHEKIFKILFFAVSIIGFTSIVGLFFFKNWARYLFISCFILLIPLGFVPETNVYTSLSRLLMNFSGYCAGAILLLCCFPSLSNFFEVRSDKLDKN